MQVQHILVKLCFVRKFLFQVMCNNERKQVCLIYVIRRYIVSRNPSENKRRYVLLIFETSKELRAVRPVIKFSKFSRAEQFGKFSFNGK